MTLLQLTREHVIRAASDLISEHGENPEYDRAIVELTGDLIGGYTSDELWSLEARIREFHEDELEKLARAERERYVTS